ISPPPSRFGFWIDRAKRDVALAGPTARAMDAAVCAIPFVAPSVDGDGAEAWTAHADLEKDQGVGLEAQDLSILDVEIINEGERQPDKDKGAEAESEHVAGADLAVERHETGELDDTVHQSHSTDDEPDRVWLHVQAGGEEDGDEGEHGDFEEGEEVKVDYGKDDVSGEESAEGRRCRVWFCGVRRGRVRLELGLVSGVNELQKTDLFEESECYHCARRAKKPPMNGLVQLLSMTILTASIGTHANVDPINHVSGIYESARGRLGVSTISPMADLMTPILPFNAPASARLMMMPINE
ncbi:282_t:CDS:2, partial [Acaulospora colombiana]